MQATVGKYKAVCLDVKNDCGEFDDLINKKGVLHIIGGDAEFKDVALCEIKTKLDKDIIKIKTGYDNIFVFKVLKNG